MGVDDYLSRVVFGYCKSVFTLFLTPEEKGDERDTRNHGRQECTARFTNYVTGVKQ